MEDKKLLNPVIEPEKEVKADDAFALEWPDDENLTRINSEKSE